MLSLSDFGFIYVGFLASAYLIGLAYHVLRPMNSWRPVGFLAVLIAILAGTSYAKASDRRCTSQGLCMTITEIYPVHKNFPRAFKIITEKDGLTTRIACEENAIMRRCTDIDTGESNVEFIK